MARGLTELDVHHAADDIVSLGERPTVERIRVHLGTGSPNTVTRWLETRWSTIGARLRQRAIEADRPDVPQAVIALALPHRSTSCAPNATAPTPAPTTSSNSWPSSGMSGRSYNKPSTPSDRTWQATSARPRIGSIPKSIALARRLGARQTTWPSSRPTLQQLETRLSKAANERGEAISIAAAERARESQLQVQVDSLAALMAKVERVVQVRAGLQRGGHASRGPRPVRDEPRRRLIRPSDRRSVWLHFITRCPCNGESDERETCASTEADRSGIGTGQGNPPGPCWAGYQSG